MITPRPTAAPLPLSRRLLAIGVVLAALLFTAVHTALPAQAAARVSVSSDLGGAKASISSPTRVSLSGSGFQSVQGGFGGIYVLFGWTASGDSWRPSKGGMTGSDYRYVPDSETKDNQGYQRFVTFPGSSTAGAANGGELHADGTWNAEMIIPGPVFDSVDRDGATQRVDCREVTCGIITVGAHGVKNPSNETFTPIEFVGDPAQTGQQAAGSSTEQAAGASGQQATGSGSQGTTSGSAESGADGADGTSTTEGATPTDAGASAEGTPEVAAAQEGETSTTDGAEAAVPGAGEPTIGLLSTELEQGDVVSFTAQGFDPGEQIVATLDLGTGAAGPYQAGQYGDVAGTVPLPTDLRPGTHVLSLSGAGSGSTARVSFTVNAAPEAPVEGAIGDTGLTWWTLALLIGIGIAAVVLLMLVVSALTALLRRRRAAKKKAAAEAKAIADAEAARNAPPAHDAGAAAAQWPVPTTEAAAPTGTVETTSSTAQGEDPLPSDGESGRHSHRGAPAALGLLAALCLGASSLLLTGAPEARADDVDVTVQIPDTADGAGEITAGVLSWGLNEETGGGAYFGGCNFLVAGKVGDVGSSHVWTASEGATHYRTSAGDVSIIHPRSGGASAIPSWDTKCIGANGSAVTTQPGSSTHNTAVFSRGEGEYDSAANTAEVSWTGSATVVFYGGMTYWTFSDPQLTVRANGTATLTATLSGFGADMYDTSKWNQLDSREVTMATLRGVDVTASGIVATPEYEGVAIDVEAGGPSGAQNRSLDGWGSFPQSFVDYQVLTGQAAYWYTSGGLADRKKPASTMIVSWDAKNPIEAELPTEGSSAAGPGGAVSVGAGGSGGVVPISGLVGSPGTAVGSQPVGPTVAQPLPPSGGSAVSPVPATAVGGGSGGSGGAVDPVTGTEVTPASAGGLVVPQWLGGDLIPQAMDTAFGTPARAATSFGVAGALSLLLWQGLRRGWFALPFLSSK
jgi:hypothetical protein